MNNRSRSRSMVSNPQKLNKVQNTQEKSVKTVRFAEDNNRQKNATKRDSLPQKRLSRREQFEVEQHGRRELNPSSPYHRAQDRSRSRLSPSPEIDYGRHDWHAYDESSYLHQSRSHARNANRSRGYDDWRYPIPPFPFYGHPMSGWFGHYGDEHYHRPHPSYFGGKRSRGNSYDSIVSDDEYSKANKRSRQMSLAENPIVPAKRNARARSSESSHF